MIEPTTPVLEGEQLNHYATEASDSLYGMGKSELFVLRSSVYYYCGKHV